MAARGVPRQSDRAKSFEISGDQDFHQLEPIVELVAADRSSQAGSLGLTQFLTDDGFGQSTPVNR